MADVPELEANAIAGIMEDAVLNDSVDPRILAVLASTLRHHTGSRDYQREKRVTIRAREQATQKASRDILQRLASEYADRVGELSRHKDDRR